MKLLAIDTASAQCSVALYVDGRYASEGVATARDHARLLLPMIDSLLRAASLVPADLDAIAFGRGPGSFTGLRIAASVAQGLALGSGCGVVPVSDLQALAEQALRCLPRRDDTDTVVACLDARMAEVYWAAFPVVAGELAGAGVVERVVAPAAVQAVPGAIVAGIGAGFATYPELAGVLHVAPDRLFPGIEPHALDVARLAVRWLESGHAPLDAEAAQPVYLRDQVVQVPISRPL